MTKYQDKTSNSANVTTGDVVHSESSAIFDSIGDCAYFGKKDKFFCAALVLSNAGVGGVVVWEYYDGSSWQLFTPESGVYNFDVNDKLVYLWQDSDSTPNDWQIAKINSYDAYWIRVRVTTGFSANPVGSQIIAVPKCNDLSLVREGA